MVKMEVTPSLSGEKSIPPAENSTPAAKKKRSLPGMPDPESEVIALSPKTLLATNRFVCEICGKGFQRDQNLQLHRRGHNLPWRLRQRTGDEPRKRVYVCPEPSCVHHDPSRALGDLTGIKKHFCRKHGEKRFTCERCSKKYAVQSDWKAHMKACGSKEYRCDCGTLFSRRDSFITHRAFCKALAQESATVRAPPPQVAAVTSSGGESAAPVDASSRPAPSPLTPHTDVLSPVLSVQSSAEPPEKENHKSARLPPPTTAAVAATATILSSSLCNSGSHISPERPAIDPISLSLSNSLYASSASLFAPHAAQNNPRPDYYAHALSATALLQKASQMGPISSDLSFLYGLDEKPVAFGLGLGPPSGRCSGIFGNELIVGPSGMYANKPPTVDFLGLGMGGGSGVGRPEGSSPDVLTFFSLVDSRVDLTAASFSCGDGWDEDSSEE